MKKDHTDSFKIILIVGSLIFIFLTSFSIAKIKKQLKVIAYLSRNILIKEMLIQGTQYSVLRDPLYGSSNWDI